MPIIKYAKLALAGGMTLIGLYGVFLMFTAEASTTTAFDNYFYWAFAAGLVFLCVGIALVAVGRDDTVRTKFDDPNG